MSLGFYSEAAMRPLSAIRVNPRNFLSVSCANEFCLFRVQPADRVSDEKEGDL